MTKMIVGITYTQDGARTISYLYFDEDLNTELNRAIADNLKKYCDEVYIVNFDPNNQDFINEIVTKGCRI